MNACMVRSKKLILILQSAAIFIFMAVLFCFVFVLSGCKKPSAAVFLTDEQMKSMPLESALKKVIGSGKRKLIVISRPDCPFCRQLHEEIKKMKDVTAYTFLAASPLTESVIAGIYCDRDPVKRLDWFFREATENRGDIKKRLVSVNGNLNCPRGSQPAQIKAFLEGIPINFYPAMINEQGIVLYGFRSKDEIDAFLSIQLVEML